MKRIGKSEAVTAANGLGHDSTAIHSDWQVEESDVGRQRENYGGYRHAVYEFKRSDVGRVIDVMTDGSQWNCWTWGSYWHTEPEPVEVVESPAPTPRVVVERQVIPVISTSHLSLNANLWLDEWGSSHSALVLAQYDCGYFLKVLDDHEEDTTLHQSIRDIAAWAKRNNFIWVRLDQDADQVDGLTSYDW